ncbi:MAG: class II SORL domain-containing protein [Candidatus Bathyarchaeota archaeon]|nr:class II SORL domain-containing protein [Candidatus Bathyarchaeota archaeon]
MAEKCEEDLFCGINRAKISDPNNMNDLEKKHTPVIEIVGAIKEGEALQVTVEVGKYMNHPNQHGHFIQWISLYSGDTFLSRIDFASERTEPKTVFTVKLDHLHPLKALGHCNMHGTWESTKEI